MYVDRFRFGNDPDRLAAVSQPSVFKLARKLKHLPRLASHARSIRRAYSALADAQSRLIFLDLLVYKYLGPYLSRLANDRAKFEELEAAMSVNIGSLPLKEPLTNSLGESLRLWSVRYNVTDLEIVTSRYGLYWMLHSDQYYFQRGEVYIGPGKGDVILDCGSHVGDISVRFAIDVGSDGKVFGFDPDPKHIAIGRENAIRNKLDGRMHFSACGVSDRTMEKPIELEDGAGRTINAGRRLSFSDASISIDNFCEQQAVQIVNYIKMDVEGSEMSALRGAERTIHRCRPKLAICVYHHPEDLWDIPNYLAERYPFYRLFLGHHSLHEEELVLYATPSNIQAL